MRLCDYLSQQKSSERSMHALRPHRHPLAMTTISTCASAMTTPICAASSLQAHRIPVVLPLQDLQAMLREPQCHPTSTRARLTTHSRPRSVQKPSRSPRSATDLSSFRVSSRRLLITAQSPMPSSSVPALTTPLASGLSTPSRASVCRRSGLARVSEVHVVLRQSGIPLRIVSLKLYVVFYIFVLH